MKNIVWDWVGLKAVRISTPENYSAFIGFEAKFVSIIYNIRDIDMNMAETFGRACNFGPATIVQKIVVCK